MSALARYVLPTLPIVANCVLGVAVFTFGYVMIALKAPVTPPNKPCRTEAKRKRLRRGAFTVLSIFLALVIASFVFRGVGARLYTAGLSLLMSTLWQITMMTKPGHAFISFFDRMFTRRKCDA
jgi:accessory gene regulator B